MKLETVCSYYTLSEYCENYHAGDFLEQVHIEDKPFKIEQPIGAMILGSIPLVTLLRCHSLHEPLKTDETIFSVLAHDRLNGPIWKYSCCRCCWRQWLAAEYNYLERYRADNIYRKKTVSMKDG